MIRELNYYAGGNPWLLSQIRGDRNTNAYFPKIQQSDRPLFSCMIVSQFVHFDLSRHPLLFTTPLILFLFCVVDLAFCFDERASFLHFSQASFSFCSYIKSKIYKKNFNAEVQSNFYRGDMDYKFQKSIFRFAYILFIHLIELCEKFVKISKN